MKKLLSLSFLSVKLSFLFCFGFMGTVMGAGMIVEEVPPYHYEIAAETGMCDVCEIAEDAWSQDYIFVNTDLDIESVTDAVAFTFDDLLNQEQVALMGISDSEHPDVLTVFHYHLIMQQGIVLVI